MGGKLYYGVGLGERIRFRHSANETGSLGKRYSWVLTRPEGTNLMVL